MRLDSIVSLDPEAKLKLLAFIVFVIPVGLLALLNPGPWEKSFERWLDKHERLRYSLLTPVAEGWFMLLILFVFFQAVLVVLTGAIALVEMFGGAFLIAQLGVGLAFYWKHRNVWSLRQKEHSGATLGDR